MRVGDVPVAMRLRWRHAIGWIGALALAGPALAADAGNPDAAHPQSADATAGDTYLITRHTIDAGGGSSNGGGYAIEGTIGQPDADPLQPSTGGPYAITGGYWTGAGAVSQPDALFANGFEG